MNKIFASLIAERIRPATPQGNPTIPFPAPPQGAPKSEAAQIAPEGSDGKRPYFRKGDVAFLPPREMFVEIYRRGGKLTLTDDEQNTLRKRQRRIDRIRDEIQKLNHSGILEAVKLARTRLQRGGGSTADAAVTRGNLVESRKSLKRQLHQAIEEAHPGLVPIAQRVQGIAKKVLPQFEKESRTLGLNPESVPAVLECARATWAPAEIARIESVGPKHFLRKLGIKL